VQMFQAISQIKSNCIFFFEGKIQLHVNNYLINETKIIKPKEQNGLRSKQNTAIPFGF